MSKSKPVSLLAVFITGIYTFFFYCNCMIVPYPSHENKEIYLTHYIYTPPGDILKDQDYQWPENIAAAAGEVFSIEGALRQSEHHELSGTLALPPEERREEPLLDHRAFASKPEPGRQGTSHMLLSGDGVVKALSKLFWKDKIWLLGILSRCSMEELMRIKAMLEDGVTLQENKAMFDMLHGKITQEEQKKLDALIEAYTR